MIKSLCYIYIFLLASLVTLGQATSQNVWVKVTIPSANILKNAFYSSRVIYQAPKDSEFLIRNEAFYHYEILLPDNQYAWIEKTNVNKILAPTQVNPPILHPLTYKPNYSYKTKHPFLDPSNHENKQLQQINTDGFYKIELSGRNYSPKDPTDPRWNTIKNDPLYNKLPPDVLLGPIKKEMSIKFSLDSQISQDTSIYFDIEKIPDFPEKWDVEINLKDNQIAFGKIETLFKNGSYSTLQKSIDGIKLKHEPPNRSIIFSNGKQRSTPQKMTLTGNGSSTYKLKHNAILNNSVSVWVNNKQLQEGTEYTVNHYTGNITFKNPKNVLDVIEIIYQYTNPIEDFIPILNKKEFTGFQAVFNNNAKRIISFTELSLTEDLQKINKQNNHFKFSKFPMVFDSEKIYLSSLNKKRNNKGSLSIQQELNAYLSVDITGNLSNQNNSQNSTQNIQTSIIDIFLKTNTKQKNSYITLVKHTDTLQGYSLQTEHFIWMPPLYNDHSPYKSTLTDLSKKESRWKVTFNNQNTLTLQALYPSVPTKNSNSIASQTSSQNLFISANIINTTPSPKTYTYHVEKHTHLKNLSDEKLFKNKDYTINYENGTIQLIKPLPYRHYLYSTFSYFQTQETTDYFVGKNTNGPFKLSESNILNKTISVTIDGKKCLPIQDYLLLNNTIIFNSSVPFPSLLSVTYSYKISKEITMQQDKTPFILGVSYFQEKVHNNNDTLFVDHEEEKTIENNILYTTFTPINDVDNVIVKINEIEQSIIDINPFTGKITLENPEDQSAIVSYQYKRSEPSLLSFYSDTSSIIYPITKQLYPNLNIPIKYNGIRKIEVNNIELNSNNYIIDWGPNGTSFNITFIEPTQQNNDAYLGPPSIGDKINIFYDYAPNISVEGTLKHQQLDFHLNKQINKNLAISAELATAYDNYSHKSTETEETLSGNNTNTITLENGNIKENSESVFLRDSDSEAWVQLEESTYYINYETGEIIFSDPISNTQQINIIYTYFLTDANAIPEDNQSKHFAKKLNLSYKSKKLESNINIEQIDLDYNPLSPISKSRGSTTIESDLTWQISSKNYLRTSYSNTTQESKTNQDNYKNMLQTEIELNKNTLANNTKIELEHEKQKENAPSETIRYKKDTLKYGINNTLKIGPENFRTEFFSNISQFLKDYIDQQKPETTKSMSNKLSSQISFQKIFLLGNTQLFPSIEYTLSDIENAEQKTSLTKKNNYQLRTTISPSSFWQTTTDYTFEKTQTLDINDTSSIVKAKNYSINMSITPYSWFKTSLQYIHNEELNDLNNTFKLYQDHIQANLLSFKVNDLLKKISFLSSPYTNNAFRYTNATGSIYKDIKKELDFSSQNTNHYQTLNLNNFELLSEAIFKDLSLTIQDNFYNNTKENSSFKNESRQTDIKNYQFTFTYFPPLKWLKKTNYYIQVKENNQDILTLSTKLDDIIQTQTTQKPNKTIHQTFKLTNAYLKTPFSESKASLSSEIKYFLESQKTHTDKTFSDINEENDPKKTADINKTRKLNIDTTIFQYINFLKLGPLTYNNKYEQLLNNSTQTTQFLQKSEDSLNDYDIRDTKTLKNELSLKPFNRFTFIQKFNTENQDNSIFNSTTIKRTYLDTQTFNSELKIPWLKKVDLFTTLGLDLTKQWEGNDINASKTLLISQLQEAKNNSIPTIFSNALDKNINNVSVGLIFKPFNNFEISSSLTQTSIKDISYSLNDQSLNTVNTNIKELKEDFTTIARPINGLTIKSVFSLKQSKHTNASYNMGYTHVLNITYIPLQRHNFKVNISLNRTDNWGTLINSSDQENNQVINASTVQTNITKQKNYTLNGNLSINIVYPFPDKPLLDNLTITGEGYIKKSQDNYNTDYTYSLSGLQLSFQLNY